MAHVCDWKARPATGKRSHVSWFARRQWSWRSLEVSPPENPGQGRCGGKDQVRWAICTARFFVRQIKPRPPVPQAAVTEKAGHIDIFHKSHSWKGCLWNPSDLGRLDGVGFHICINIILAKRYWIPHFHKQHQRIVEKRAAHIKIFHISLS